MYWSEESCTTYELDDLSDIFQLYSNTVIPDHIFFPIYKKKQLGQYKFRIMLSI